MSNAVPSKQPPSSPSGTATTAATAGVLEKFLTARGLDTELAVKLGMTASNGCIEIPYRRDGEAIYRKYRRIVEKGFSCDPGHKPFFWNIDALYDETLKSEPLVITEGEFDALAAMQAGFLRTISVPNGAPAQKDAASMAYLEEVAHLLKEIPEIIVASDSDEAGENLLHDISVRIGRARCKWVKYPKGCKDLNDALRVYGEKGVQESLRRAQWMHVEGVYRMSELAPVPYRRPYSTGIEGLDPYLRIRKGDFSVLTGIPGHGKTAFANDMLSRLVCNHGFRPGIASFEQQPQTDHRRNLRTWYASKFEKDLSDEERERADKWIDESFMFIVPGEDDDVTLEWTLERAATAVIRHRVDFLLVDPWNEMDHARDRDESLTEYTGKAIKHFKKFAKKYNCHVMVVAHPAKMRRLDNGTYPVPTLYDISDSAHWYNKADLGIVVYRGDNGDFIRIAKSRYHTEIGKPGDVDVKFSPDTGRFIVVDNKVLMGDER